MKLGLSFAHSTRRRTLWGPSPWLWNLREPSDNLRFKLYSLSSILYLCVWTISPECCDPIFWTIDGNLALFQPSPAQPSPASTALPPWQILYLHLCILGLGSTGQWSHTLTPVRGDGYRPDKLFILCFIPLKITRKTGTCPHACYNTKTFENIGILGWDSPTSVLIPLILIFSELMNSPDFQNGMNLYFDGCTSISVNSCQNISGWFSIDSVWNQFVFLVDNKLQVRGSLLRYKLKY